MQQGIQEKTIARLDGFYNINTNNPSRFIDDKNKATPIDPTKDILNSKLDSDYLSDIMDLTHKKNVENLREQKRNVDENRSENRRKSRDDSSSEKREGREEREGSRYYEYDIDIDGLSLPPVILTQDAVLKKGYQRAAVLCPCPIGLIIKNNENGEFQSEKHENALGSIPKMNLNNNIGERDNEKREEEGSLQMAVYEVIIHGGEAFVKQKQIEIENTKGRNGADQSPKILDYSTGWQHSLVVLE